MAEKGKQKPNSTKIYNKYLFIILVLLILYIFGLLKITYDKYTELEYLYNDIELKITDNNLKINKIVEFKKNIIIDDIIKIEKQNILYLELDNSIQKFVTSNKSFNNRNYIPKNLVLLSSEYVYDRKGGTQLIRKITNQNLQKLAKKFKETFGKKIIVVSGYRSYNYQQGIKNRGCPDNLCAKAGFSEHQSGLAVDLFEASSNYSWKNNSRLSKYYKWLDENAHKYGFHNTYQKGLQIDGYEIEPWHWRYLGINLATKLKNEKITIAEYYRKQKK